MIKPAPKLPTRPATGLRAIEPTCDMPLSVAMEELTGFEVIAIQKHYRANIDELGAIMMMIGAVWAYECRATNKPVGWSTIEAFTLRELTGYFQPEPGDAMPEEPDSELGKASSPAV